MITLIVVFANYLAQLLHVDVQYKRGEPREILQRRELGIDLFPPSTLTATGSEIRSRTTTMLCSSTPTPEWFQCPKVYHE